MKKVLSLVLVLVLLVTLLGCNDTPEETVEEVTLTILSIDEFEIDGFTTSQLQKSRPPVHLYYDIVGYTENGKPIKNRVASCLEFEIGEVIEVATIDIERFTYHAVIQDSVIDTSWHEYEVK
jgi:hypothetical protein